MITDQWQLGLLFAVIAAHALLTYWAVRRRRAGTEAGRPASVDRGTGVVECPDCGAENERGYRYCRSCVGTLPMARAFRSRDAGPRGRFVQ